MNIIQSYLTNNPCYKAGRKITVKGLMLHSVGCPQPKASVFVKNWNKASYDRACVHGFIDANTGDIYQTLPWDRRGWHAGKGARGTANNTHIGFEICEDGLDDPVYFQAAYREAVELTAMLCREFGLDPLADGVIICHAEGHKRGLASNHGDVLHWFPKFGKDMDAFRADVARELEGGEDMTQEQFDAMMDNYLALRGRLPADPWAEAPLRSAIQGGITDGTRPLSFATRQEVALMVHAATKA